MYFCSDFLALVCLILVFSVFSSTALACGSCIVLRPTYKGLITGDGVNFRSNYYLTASVGGQLQRGDVLTVDRQFDGTDYTWYHGIVESASSLELIGDGGWVAHSFIRLI